MWVGGGRVWEGEKGRGRDEGGGVDVLKYCRQVMVMVLKTIVTFSSLSTQSTDPFFFRNVGRSNHQMLPDI